MVPTCYAQPVPREWCFSLSSGESEFHALLKGTRDAGAVSMISDLVVDVSENRKIGRAVLDVRIGASAGQGIAVRVGRIREFATPTVVVQKLTQDSKSKSLKILGVSNPQLSGCSRAQDNGNLENDHHAECRRPHASEEHQEQRLWLNRKI